MKIINLIPSIQVTEALLAEVKKKHEKEISELTTTLDVLRRTNTACFRCNGIGSITYRATAECDVETVSCPDCSGTGEHK